MPRNTFDRLPAVLFLALSCFAVPRPAHADVWIEGFAFPNSDAPAPLFGWAGPQRFVGGADGRIVNEPGLGQVFEPGDGYVQTRIGHLIPTASSPLELEVDLFRRAESSNATAILAWRSTTVGSTTFPFFNEPTAGLYLRIPAAPGKPIELVRAGAGVPLVLDSAVIPGGAAFFQGGLHVRVTDDGTRVTAELRGANGQLSLKAKVTDSFLENRVGFGGQWDFPRVFLFDNLRVAHAACVRGQQAVVYPDAEGALEWFFSPEQFTRQFLTLPIPGVSDRAPAISFDGTQVAFRSNRSGTDELWIVGVDGTGLRQATQLGQSGLTFGGDGRPAWHPSGERIFFEAGAPGADLDLYVLKLNANAASSPSPGNVSLFYQTRGVDDRHPAVSPDGKRLAFVIGSDLHLMDTGPLHQNLTLLRTRASWPTWHPDGRRLAIRDEYSVGIVLFDLTAPPPATARLHRLGVFTAPDYSPFADLWELVPASFVGPSARSLTDALTAERAVGPFDVGVVSVAPRRDGPIVRIYPHEPTVFDLTCGGMPVGVSRYLSGLSFDGAGSWLDRFYWRESGDGEFHFETAGKTTLHLVAQNGLGATSEAPVEFTLNAVAPTVTRSLADPGVGYVELAFNVAPASVAISIDGTPEFPLSLPPHPSFSERFLLPACVQTSGPHTARVRMVDQCGMAGESIINFEGWDEPAELVPENDLSTVQGGGTLSFRVFPRGADRVKFQFDGLPEGSAPVVPDVAGFARVEFPVPDLATGPHTLSLRVSDDCGYEAGPFQFDFQIGPPKVSIQEQPCSDGVSWVDLGHIFPFTFLIEPASLVSWSLDGVPREAPAEPTTALLLPVDAVEGGPHLVSIQTINLRGERTTFEFQVGATNECRPQCGQVCYSP